MTDWMTRAACGGADADHWFPVRGQNIHDVLPALAICRQCPVSRDCYEYADANNEQFGIWGGVNFASARARRITLTKAMNEIWAAQGLPPVKLHSERLAEAKRHARTSPQPDAVVLPMPAPRLIPEPQRGLTIDERRRLRAADATEVSA